MTLDDYRRFYSEEVRYFANIKTAGLVAAFAQVPREKFVGPGPWRLGLSGLKS